MFSDSAAVVEGDCIYALLSCVLGLCISYSYRILAQSSPVLEFLLEADVEGWSFLRFLPLRT